MGRKDDALEKMMFFLSTKNTFFARTHATHCDGRKREGGMREGAHIHAYNENSYKRGKKTRGMRMRKKHTKKFHGTPGVLFFFDFSGFGIT